MAIGVFKLSEKQRFRWAYIFNILNLIQVILGLSITGTSVYIYISVSPILYSDKAEVNFVFVVTGIFGTHIVLFYLMGLKICWKSLYQAHKKSTRGLLVAWSFGGILTLMNLIVIGSFARKINYHIIKSMRHSIKNGMLHYLKDLSWKRTIDKIQLDLKCCGVESFDDWYQLDWLNIYQINNNSQVVGKFKSGTRFLSVKVLPWSCCNTEFDRQCFHDPIQQITENAIWKDSPDMVSDSINSKGCLMLLKEPIQNAILAFVFTIYFILFIHVVLFLVSRVLYTSARNAILMGNPHGKAPGWVFGRGDCGYMGGKSIAEIMANEEEEEELEPIKKGSNSKRSNQINSRGSSITKKNRQSSKKIQTKEQMETEESQEAGETSED